MFGTGHVIVQQVIEQKCPTRYLDRPFPSGLLTLLIGYFSSFPCQKLVNWKTFLSRLCSDTPTKSVIRVRPSPRPSHQFRFLYLLCGCGWVRRSWHHVLPFIGVLCTLSLSVLFSLISRGWFFTSILVIDGEQGYNWDHR